MRTTNSLIKWESCYAIDNIMIKMNYRNVLAYIFFKYLIFYIFMMFKNKNYNLVRIDNLKSVENWFYYLFQILSLPVMMIILFSAPIYFSFRIKNAVIFGIINILILFAEYLLYTYSESQLDLFNGVYNAIMSLMIFYLFFSKEIVSKVNLTRNNKFDKNGFE
jgi:hypothetical protein